MRIIPSTFKVFLTFSAVFFSLHPFWDDDPNCYTFFRVKATTQMWWPCTCCPPASEWITTMIVCQQPYFISGSPHVVSLILNLDDHMYILYVCTIYNMYIHTYIWCIYIYIHRFTQQTFFSPLALKKKSNIPQLVGWPHLSPR